MDNTFKKDLDSLLKLSDRVIAYPSIDITESAKNIHASSNIINCTCGIVQCAQIMETGFSLWTVSPVIALAKWVYDKFTEHKRKQEEKERALREIIRKQQAIIRELEKQNIKNQQEIKNLKKMLEILEDAENGLRNAA